MLSISGHASGRGSAQGLFCFSISGVHELDIVEVVAYRHPEAYGIVSREDPSFICHFPREGVSDFFAWESGRVDSPQASEAEADSFAFVLFSLMFVARKNVLRCLSRRFSMREF